MALRALVIEDDAVSRRSLAAALRRLDLDVLEAVCVEEGRPLLDEGVTVVFLDLELPGMPGGAFLRQVSRTHPQLPVVIVTSDKRLERAVEMMRRGAFDYIAKPLDPDGLQVVVERARGEYERRREVLLLREERDRREGLKAVIGSSPPMRKVHEQVRQAAPSMISVVLLGESGTGKELLARAIHHESPRRDGPFVALNCAAAPTSLLESLLFGHRAGAFPGASESHRGRLLTADGGTLYLDEIGEMQPALQAKLLRTLQERTIHPLGADEDVPVDVRIVASTRSDIHEKVADGSFRQDLFYRLVAFPILIPSLREHPQDIPELAYHFLHKHRTEAGRQEVIRIADEAMARLITSPWPGNVRQLENAIYNALLSSAGGPSLLLEALPSEIASPATSPPAHLVDAPPQEDPSEARSAFHDPETGLLLPLRRIEELAFQLAMSECGGNATQAAKALGVARATLYRRMKIKRSA